MQDLRKIRYKWYVNSEVYNSTTEAAIANNVTDQTIINWCRGYQSKDGTQYKPKKNCRVEKIIIDVSDQVRTIARWDSMLKSKTGKVNKRWSKFKNFYSDMGICPEDHYLHRKKVNKPFTLSNCFWGKGIQNPRNRWHVNGKYYNRLEDAAKEYKVTKFAIHNWCKGYTTSSGYWIPPRKNCWVEKL